MDNEQLQKWVEEISITSFGRPFLHQATFNHRIRSTGGRYFPATHHIEISSLQLEVNGKEEVEKIIKHELCHYHLHLSKRGYRHRDQDFKRLLIEVGGSRYCKPLSVKPKEQKIKYLLICTKCKTEYYRKRKVDVSKYRCGNCRDKLELYLLDV